MSSESNARSHAEEFHWWRGSPELDVEVAELRDLAALRNATEDLIALQVKDLREAEGASWTGVAAILGISTQAAHERYSKPCWTPSPGEHEVQRGAMPTSGSGDA